MPPTARDLRAVRRQEQQQLDHDIRMLTPNDLQLKRALFIAVTVYGMSRQTFYSHRGNLEGIERSCRDAYDDAAPRVSQSSFEAMAPGQLCPICRDALQLLPDDRTPRRTACNHMFCGSCFREFIVRQHLDGNFLVIACPLCRENVDVHYENRLI